MVAIFALNAAWLVARHETLTDFFIGSTGHLIYTLFALAFVYDSTGNVLTGAVYAAVYLMPLLYIVGDSSYHPATRAGRLLQHVTVERIVAFVMLVGAFDLWLYGVRYSWVILTALWAFDGDHIAIALFVGATVISAFRLRNQYLLFFAMPVLIYALFVTIRLVELATSYPPIPIWVGFVVLIVYFSVVGDNEHEFHFAHVADNPDAATGVNQ